MKKALLSLAIFTFTFSLLTSSQIISTIAGNGTSGYSGDGGPATAAEMKRPYGLVVDNTNNIYVADYSGASVRMINTSGLISSFVGNGTAAFGGDGGPATAAQVNGPAGLYFESSTGSIYFADAGNERIRVVNSSGVISTIAGNGTNGYSGDGGQATAAQLSIPFDVAKDAQGNMYIADYSNYRIRIINTSGIINTFAGNGTAGYSGDGGPATAAQINTVPGILIDHTGNVFIGDYLNNRVRMINTSGAINTFAGNGVAGYSGDGGQATAAELNYPVRMAMDVQGNIYIAEYGGQRVRRVSTSGIITTVAGNGATGFSGDNGPATAAEMDEPLGVTFDAAGNLYIADASNYRVREVTGIPLSVNELSAGNKVNVYPNPASDNVTVQLGNASGKTTVTMYSITGQEMLNTVKENTGNFSINVANFAAGTYMIKLQTEDGTILTKKIEIAR